MTGGVSINIHRDGNGRGHRSICLEEIATLIYTLDTKASSCSCSGCDAQSRLLPWVQLTYDELTYSGCGFDDFVVERSAGYISQLDM